MAGEKVLALKCTVQNYAWGKPGGTSEVARLCVSGIPDFKLQGDSPYAELWMGTHPKGPSQLQDKGDSLSHWLSDHPESRGDKVNQCFPVKDQLPYLFKVLSVNKSLSIQAHPNKKHAETLHKERPDAYPDPNHKPEMAIALTRFEGMCGFRPKKEIDCFLQKIPELNAVIGKSSCDEFISNKTEESNITLKKCFSNLMTSSTDLIQTELSKLVARLTAKRDGGADISDEEGELLLRLNSQFPGDVGCFCVYFLNHMWLEPGEAMFLEANLPHAYLSGDCIECMACSDNVVRAGLTPKYKDVSTLCEMLNYTLKSAEENLFQPVPSLDDCNVLIYNPPVKDFTVAKIQIPADTQEYNIQPVDSASILLVINGEADVSNRTLGGSTLHIKTGSVVFIGAGETLKLNVSASGMLMFKAYCHL